MAEEKSLEDRVADAVLGEDDSETPTEGEITDEQPEEAPDPSEDEEEPENTPTEGSDEESDEDPKEDEPELFEVEWNGALYEVNKDVKEAIEQATDYTKKTQKLSAERKEMEIVRTQIEQSQKQYEFANSIQQEAGQLQTLDWQIQQGNQYLRDNFDKLSDKEILHLRMQLDDAKTQKEGVEKALQSKFGEFQQAQEQSQRELLDKSTEVLRSKVQNWDKVKDEVIEFVKGNGFTDQDVQIALTDPRQIQLAVDAMKYRQLKDKTTAAVKKVDSAPIKPKSRDPMPEHVKKGLNLRKQRKAAKSNRERERLIQEEMATKLGL